MLFVQHFLCLETVFSDQPVRLIQAVFPQQGRGLIPGEQRMIAYRYIGGVEHPPEGIFAVKRCV